jgi:hypothetical protein
MGEDTGTRACPPSRTRFVPGSSGSTTWCQLIRGSDNSALESEIAAAVALDRSAASELERSLAPALNVVTELLVAGVVELKPSRQ